MLQYVFKRILYFIPTFLLVSLIIFFLSKAAGERLRCEDDPNGPDMELCIEEARQKGYDKPVFYFTFSTAAHPDTLYKVFREERRAALHKLVGQYGNWPQINQYNQILHQVDAQLGKINEQASSSSITQLQKVMEVLHVAYKDKVISNQLEKVEKAIQDTLLQTLKPQAIGLIAAYQAIKTEATPNQLYFPSINWYGLNNQYHIWMTNFLVGDFGVSHRDNIPVVDKIKARLPWTLYINIPSILIAYLLSIPLGIYSAIYQNTRFDKFVSTLLLFFFSLPVFWIGTLLVNFLTTPEYGMGIFPPIGLKGDALTWENITRLFLPVFCVTYGALAFMTRQMRSSMLSTLQQDFIRTARAKGLSEKTVIWKHAFRNSLFPLITMFGSILPAAFAGSLVVEFIFNITGMGWLLLGSIQTADWPVVYSILMIAAVLTMLGLLIADILYVVVDPRVRLDKK